MTNLEPEDQSKSPSQETEPPRRRTITIPLPAVSSVWHAIVTSIDWLNHRSGLLVGIATVALVAVTYFYLQEVRGQRADAAAQLLELRRQGDLLAEQIRLEAKPEVQILAARPFSFGTMTTVRFAVQNYGGPVENAALRWYVICCDILINMERDPSALTVEKGSSAVWPLLTRNIIRSTDMRLPEDHEIVVIAKGQEHLEPPRIWAYVEVEYWEPPILSGDRQAQRHHAQALGWIAGSNQWYEASESQRSLLRGILETRGEI